MKYYVHTHARRLSRIAALLLLLGAGSRLSAADLDGVEPDVEPDSEHADAHVRHEHQCVTVDAALDWETLIERTLANFPSYIEIVAQEQEAYALSERARSWLAGQPSVSFGYVSDAARSDLGLAEYQSGVNLPLWRNGQRNAARAVGRSAHAESGAALAALRWEVAGRLREALWNMLAAANDLALASEALEVAQEVERVVARRHETGELALADTLLAEENVLERRRSVLEMEAEVVDAERVYIALTGLAIRPDAFAEVLTARPDFDAAHPLLALKNAELDRARSDRDFVDRAVAGNPTLAIGPKRQRDPLTSFYVDSVTVGIDVPFGGKRHGNTEAAAARRRVAAAEAERAAVLRGLDAELHEARHTLEVTEEALALAERRVAIAERHRQMGRTAFTQGEITLVELLRREESSRTALRELERLRIARGRTIAQVNQAIGELP